MEVCAGGVPKYERTIGGWRCGKKGWGGWSYGGADLPKPNYILSFIHSDNN